MRELTARSNSKLWLWQGLPRSGERIPPKMPSKGGLPEKRSIPNVKRVVAVASGKGGVGKSTVAGRAIIRTIDV